MSFFVSLARTAPAAQPIPAPIAALSVLLSMVPQADASTLAPSTRASVFFITILLATLPPRFSPGRFSFHENDGGDRFKVSRLNPNCRVVVTLIVLALLHLCGHELQPFFSCIDTLQ